MKVIGRLFGLLTGGLMLASIVGMLAARAAKQHIEPLDTPDADDVRLVAILEPMSFRSTATSFRGGSVDCWYGGGVIDLRDAVLDPTGHDSRSGRSSAGPRSSSLRAGGSHRRSWGSAGSVTVVARSIVRRCSPSDHRGRRDLRRLRGDVGATGGRGAENSTRPSPAPPPEARDRGGQPASRANDLSHPLALSITAACVGDGR